MRISRKEFICRGIFTFGQDLFDSLKVRSFETDAEACGESYSYLVLDNSRCLAQKGGCFTCIDHCPQAAVNISQGRGITIDNELCDGCGECAAVCPITPGVIEMKPTGAESNKN